MSTDFKWQTEEDGWNEEPIFPEEVERPKKRWWPAALVVVIIVGTIGFLIYRQVQRQLEAAVSRTENDVRRTHGLVLQAADRRDRDLLISVVSGRDEEWLNNQLQLAEEGLLYNPTPLGFVVQNDSLPQYEFEISADLSEAEVFTTRNFTIQSPTGISETVALKQHAFYRRGADRWLFSPPQSPSDYWQGSLEEEGEYLTILYPVRDAKYVKPLSQFLNAKLAQLCTGLPDFSCPEDFHLHLGLSTDPLVQLPLLETRSLFENEPEITLPTMTIVGLPVDQAGTDALYRGYAVHVIRAAVIQALNWNCCQRGLFFRALLDYQMAELGLSPYPIHPADYEKLFSRFQQIGQLDEFWLMRQIELVDADNWQWPYALTEFVLSSPFSETTAGAMQKSLVESSLYQSWLDDLFSRSILDISVQQAWLNFIYSSSLSGQVVEGEFVPQEDILLYCDNITPPRTVLYRYDWSEDGWRIEDQFDEATMFMVSTPDDSAVIFQQSGLEGPDTTFLWQDGRTTSLFNGTFQEQPGYYFVGLMDPDGRKLVMIDQNQEAGFAILDLETCTETGCQLILVPGIPRWSPNGSQIVLQLLDMSENIQEAIGLARIDSTGQFIELSKEGFAPFWFSDEEYGFIDYSERGSIYAALTAGDESHLVLSEAALLQAIPEAQRPDSLIIQSVTPNPANRNILAIVAFIIENDRFEYRLFFWNRLSGDLTDLTEPNSVLASSPEWLPSGEWLAVPTYEERQGAAGALYPASYHLFHVSGEGQPINLAHEDDAIYPAYDYSTGGDWLILPHSSYLEVIGLKHTLSGNRPYRRLLAYNFNNCRNALFTW